MNDSAIRRLCESRFRWPVVLIATALVTLAVVLPAADDYFDKRRNRNELLENLHRTQETAQALPTFEGRAAEVAGRLAALETRSIDDADVAPYRNRIVDLVRDSGCQIRQLEIGEPRTRQWFGNDDPLVDSPRATVAPTPFNLQRRNFKLAVDGPMIAIHDLLARLEEDHSIAHPHRVELHSAAAGGDVASLELELWLFALTRDTR